MLLMRMGKSISKRFRLYSHTSDLGDLGRQGNPMFQRQAYQPPLLTVTDIRIRRRNLPWTRMRIERRPAAHFQLPTALSVQRLSAGGAVLEWDDESATALPAWDLVDGLICRNIGILRQPYCSCYIR